MSKQTVFPAFAMATKSGEPSVQIEGQKVMFDKKVSLLPVDVRKEALSKSNAKNGVAK